MKERSARNRRPWSSVALFVGLLAGLFAARQAEATFHFMMIVEVFVGGEASPDAQYVVLQMYEPNQTNLSTHPMRFFDATGASLGTASFGTISNGADDAHILIATSTAEELFGVAADLRIPPRMPAAGGKVCFDTIDCFAWGAYSVDDVTVGTPYTDFIGTTAAVRFYAGALDATDDTNDSQADFQADPLPEPTNNSGVSGYRNQDAVWLDGFEDGGFAGWLTEPPTP